MEKVVVLDTPEVYIDNQADSRELLLGQKPHMHVNATPKYALQ